MSPIIYGTKSGLRFRTRGEKLTVWTRLKLAVFGAVGAKEDPAGNDMVIYRSALDYAAAVPQAQLAEADAKHKEQAEEEEALRQRQVAIQKAQMELQEEELKRRGKKIQVAGMIPGGRDH